LSKRNAYLGVPPPKPASYSSRDHEAQTENSKKNYIADETELDSLLDLPCDSEAVIRERLLAIVSYLSLVQEK